MKIFIFLLLNICLFSAVFGQSQQLRNTENSLDKTAWKTGDRVFGFWSPDSYFYPATIRKVEGASYYVVFDDGDERWLRNSELQSDNIAVGRKVYGNWKLQGLYYPGKVKSRDGDTIVIAYDDGDVEKTSISVIRIR